LGGNNDVITELFLPRGSLVSDISAGDGKLVNLFLLCSDPALAGILGGFLAVAPVAGVLALMVYLLVMASLPLLASLLLLAYLPGLECLLLLASLLVLASLLLLKFLPCCC
jgi:hypothetical protein